MGAEFGFEIKNNRIKTIKTIEDYRKAYTDLCFLGNIGKLDTVISSYGKPGCKDYQISFDNRLVKVTKEDNEYYYSLTQRDVEDIADKLRPAYKALILLSERILSKLASEYDDSELKPKFRKELKDLLYDAYECDYEDVFAIIRVYEACNFIANSDLISKDNYSQNDLTLIYWRSI